MSDFTEHALSLLPWRLRAENSGAISSRAEELRLRIGRRPTALIDGEERAISSASVTAEDLHLLLEKATGASLHTVSFALREGYLSYRGLRIGVCGQAVIREDGAAALQNVSSVAIRIPHELRGICSEAMHEYGLKGFHSTLLISPPGWGKTTALREIIRRLSEAGRRVCVADERNELSASVGGAAQFDLGPCTDVLIGIPRSEASLILLRGMNPEILAMDEITKEKDAEALLQCCGCGVELLASAHAEDLSSLSRRPVYRKLLEEKLFTYLLLIRRAGTERSYTLCRIPY